MKSSIYYVYKAGFTIRVCFTYIRPFHYMQAGLKKGLTLYKTPKFDSFSAYHNLKAPRA